ncbi:hypothetical protein [Paeniglutamicibacter kerguelensis]|uniref:Uncharacterized protein n=1 Tax=Paeniglutamicibacter kerguelensis TaxID=254788 RepID=A0ABS4XJN6_9MICC|nr:hypothetical protein [Paeniglutamicibacter kerguelensis]MBP2388670.1 hypothetical protein [Paeniglutamicibacter kerguelensis]
MIQQAIPAAPFGAVFRTVSLELGVSPADDEEVSTKRTEVSLMRGSNLVWTIVGVLLAIALVIWIASAI